MMILVTIRNRLNIITSFLDSVTIPDNDDTSRNAVMTQIWIALIVYFLLSLIKFKAKIGWSIHRMLRVLQLNLFERRELLALFDSQQRKVQPPDPLPLFQYL